MEKISFPGLNIGPFEIKNTFSLFGLLDLHFYAVIIAFGMALAVGYAFWRFYANKIRLDIVLDYAGWILPLSIVGARIYFVLFDMLDPQAGGSYFDNVIYVSGGDKTLDFFGGRIVAFLYDSISVWNGGLAIYGGVIAGGIVIAVISYFKKMNTMKILDIAVPAVLFAQVLGRWGNFFNVEAYGGVTTLPWRMFSTDEIYYYLISQNVPIDQIANGEFGVHPTFLYESLWNIIGVLIMIGTLIVSTLILKVSKEKHIDGIFFAFYMTWYGFGRMFIEQLRTDSLWLIPGVIRASVFVAVVTFIAGVLLMAFLITRRVLLVKKNVDIWEKFKEKIKTKKAETKDGTDN